ncbi:uncharacterized protein ACIGJ3_021865 [Trichechus inunguis]
MVRGFAAERRLHKDLARGAAGTRLPGPTRRRRGAAGWGAAGHARGRLRKPALGPARDQSTMSASEQSSEASSPPPQLPPPLPPPPGPPVAAEGRGAQAAGAAASWAGIRESRQSGAAATGLLICMRLACARPAPSRSALRLLICMHIPSRHIPGLNPVAPGARCNAAGRGGGEPGDVVGGKSLGMHCLLPPLGSKYFPTAKRLGFLTFRDWKD